MSRMRKFRKLWVGHLRLAQGEITDWLDGDLPFSNLEIKGELGVSRMRKFRKCRFKVLKA